MSWFDFTTLFNLADFLGADVKEYYQEKDIKENIEEDIEKDIEEDIKEDIEEDIEEDVCSICLDVLDVINNIFITSCYHKYHKKCIEAHFHLIQSTQNVLYVKVT